jgi:hypothetical protein
MCFFLVYCGSDKDIYGDIVLRLGWWDSKWNPDLGKIFLRGFFFFLLPKLYCFVDRTRPVVSQNKCHTKYLNFNNNLNNKANNLLCVYKI